MKLLYFDLETTRSNPGKNGIHQISGMTEMDSIADFKASLYPGAVIYHYKAPDIPRRTI